MKSNVRSTSFGSKFLLMCILLHFSSALPSSKLSAAPPHKNHDAEAKAAMSSKSATSKAVSLPLFFEANEGQTDSRVRFLTRSSGYTLFLTPTETVLAESKTQLGESGGGWGGGIPEIKSTAGSFVRMQLLGVNTSPAMTGLEELPGKVNYLIGRDSSQWQTGVSLFSKVRTDQVYPGVDLLFHGDDKQLEYDFIVAPGADPSKIVFRIRGAARIEVDANGDLVLHAVDSEFRMHKPFIYQAVGTERRLIAGSFIRKGKHDVAFQIGPYDHTRALVIDPEISFATFLGGKGVDQGNDIALDTSTPGAPKVYVPGLTNDITSYPASDFTSSGAPKILGAAGGAIYSFLAKIDPTKTGAASLIYLTFLGGSTSPTAGVPCDTVHGRMVLDFSQGSPSIEPVMTGQTNCTNFPVTNGSSLTSGGQDIYVTRLMPSGAALDVSILFGGNGLQGGGWLDVDGSGNLLLVAGTTSTNLPTTSGAYSAGLNNSAGGFADCFAAVFNRALSSTTYLTYLNIGASSTANSQVGCGGIFGPSGKILAGGNTPTATAFASAPAGTGGFQTTFEGTEDTFAMELDPSKTGVAQLAYWTFIGGGASTTANYGAIPIGAGVVAIVGNTTSSAASNPPDIPVNNCFQNTNTATSSSDKGTGYLTIIDTSQTGAASLLCGTYFGGSGGDDKVQSVGFDPVGGSGSYRILLGGQTSSTDFPIKNELQDALAGSQNGFVSVLTIPSVPGAPAPAPPFAMLSFSTYIGGGVTSSGQSDTVQGVAADTNHNIYARARTLSSNFFGNTSPATIVNGFQTTCTSCGATPPEDDVAIFVISSQSAATLQSIAVTPASPSIAQGATQQFTATGTYSDGTIQDLTATATWASTVTSVATISNTSGSQGLATASTTNSGSTQITAALNGLTSAAATLTVTAPVTVNVSVASNNTSGGTIVDNSTPLLINCFTNGAGLQAGTCQANYAAGAVVIFTETPGPGAALSSWNGPCTAPTGGTTTTCKITVTNPIGVTSAIYTNGTAGPFTLTMALPANQAASTGNGTVNSGVTGGGIDCKFVGTTPPAPVTGGVCTNSAEKDGGVIQLIPTPDQNSTFGGWAGTCPFQLTGSNDCYITMSQAQTVTPVFTAIPVTVNVSITGNGSVVDQATNLIHCSNTNGSIVGPCSGQYSSGTIVTLTESAGTGYIFTSFTGCNTTTATTCTLNLNSTNPVVNLTATFNTTAAPVTLTLSLSGTNGSVLDQNNAGKIQCSVAGGVVSGTCSAPYNPGTQVSLQATGGTGSSFNGWTAGPCGDMSTNPCAFTITTNTNATATFTATAQTFTLMVNEAGSSSGTVTSQSGLNPAINCTSEGAGCSATYNSGTQVTLAAAPATGSSFMGWAGGTPACSGTGTCAVTMNQTQSVTAIFNSSGPAIIADWNVTGVGDNDKQRIDGKSPPLLVKLTNTSPSQTIHVKGVSADNAAYTVTTTCTSLGPGQSCTVSSSFTATSPCQSQSTTITVADDDPGGNFTFTIEGLGADSGLQVDDLTDPSLTPQSLAQSLVGPGVTISNVTYTGANRAAGNFTSSSNIIGFNSGIVLSTGSVRNTVGPNCSTGISVDNGEPGDPDLSTLSGGATNDAAVLQFDFVPTSSSISFQYVFASDEYNEFVFRFNDTFAFFLNGTNIAVIPGTNLAVSINNVNDGNPVGTNPVNPQLYINNDFQFPTAAPVDTEMDGLTVPFTAQAQVTPGNTYHIKLAIADALDFALDSNVFIKAGSLSSTALSFSPSSVAFGNQPVGVQSAGMPVTLTNNGTTAVNISGIAATPPFGETNNCPAQLAPMGQTGSSCIITVTVTPSSATTLTGSLTVTDNSPTAGNQQSIPLSGTGTSTGAAVLSITKTHTGNFTQGQQGAKYTVTVSNAAGAGSTSGTVTVTDTIPAGLTLVSMAGTGWTCGTPNPANVCTRADALAGGVSYPTITVTVNVAANATSPQVNTVSVSGGGSPSATATDSTIITVVTPPALSISKTHTGNFAQGQQGATYTVPVSNASTAGPTSGTVTVTETVPSGLTLVSMAGTGWTCGNPNLANVCTRTDSLGGDSSYPSITVTVNVAANATSPQVNSVTVSGGGSASATATDSTTIITNAPVLKITKTHSGSFLNGQQGATYTVTVSNAAGAGATSGTVTVTDSVPEELTLVSMAGTGWTCGTPNPANACTRTDALVGGASYPAITVTVNVANGATSPQVNTVTVSGGGSVSATANDSTTITNSPVVITVAPPPPGTPSVPVIDPGGAATYGLVLTSQPGFTGTVTLSCTATTSTGAPASQFITCAPDPNSVVIKPGGTTQVAIVLNTFCSQNAPLDIPVPGGPAGVLILLLTALALASVTWMYRRRPRWVLTFAALTIAVYSIVGCGSTPSGPAGRTPAGNYNLALSFRVNGGPPIPGPLLQLIIK